MKKSISTLLVLTLTVVVSSPTNAAVPATVIAKAGEMILSHLDKAASAREMEKINSQLSEIRGKLDEINRDVKAALAALHDIRKRQDDVVDQTSQNGVWAAIGTILANFQGWSTKPERYENAEELALQELQGAARNLMRNRAYLNFTDAGYAMLIERDMLQLMRKPKPFRKAAFEQYAQYFYDTANDVSKPFTVAALLQAAIDARDAEQAFLSNLPAEPLCPDYTRSVCAGECKSCTYDQFTVMARGADGRYFHNDARKTLRNERQCGRDSGCSCDREVGSRRPDKLVLGFGILAATAQASSMNDHSQCAYNLNQRLDNIQTLNDQVAKLQDAKAVCSQLEQRARQFAAE
jgi:hypothetical protein